MPETFEWQTEEEAWEAREEKRETADSPRRRLRPLILTLFIFVSLILAGAYVYNQLDDQISSTADAITADVVATHQLVLEAVQMQDKDLFTSLLSDDNTFWRRTRRQMLDLFLVLDRAPLGLWADKQGEATGVDVSLSPDLTQAEVTDLYPYVIESDPGVMETIFLLRTSSYTREGERWQLASLPEDREYWGPWITEEGEYLDLVFAERDADVGRRLAPELDQLVQQLCADSMIRCRPGFRFQLRLARDTAVLLHLRESYERLHVGYRLPTNVHLDLPSPTLVGKPIDEAGYEALQRGYAGWIAALMVYRLQPEQSKIYPQVPAWLDEMAISLPPPVGYRPRPLVTEPPPVPFPAQQVQLLCTPDDAGSSYLTRYDPQEDTWPHWAMIPDEGIAAIVQMMPSLADDGVMLTVRDLRLRHRTLVWTPEESRPLVETERSHHVLEWLLPEISHDERYLPVYETRADGDPEGQILVVDRQDCDAEGCPVLSMTGLPYWSPDGRFSLILETNGWPVDLTLADAEGNPLLDVGTGWGPIWLENNRLGYIRTLGDISSERPLGELVTVDIQVDPLQLTDPVPVLDAADLWETLQKSPDVDYRLINPDILIYDLYRHPVRPELLLISAVGYDEFSTARQFYFLYDRKSGGRSLLFGLENTAASLPRLTENGRFLTVLAADSASLTLYVHDMDFGQTYTYPIFNSNQYPFPTYDWSLDQQWIVFNEDRALHFIAPAYGYEYTVYHNNAGCSTAVWVNP